MLARDVIVPLGMNMDAGYNTFFCLAFFCWAPLFEATPWLSHEEGNLARGMALDIYPESMLIKTILT